MYRKTKPIYRVGVGWGKVGGKVLCLAPVIVCAWKEGGCMHMDVSTLNFEMRNNFVFTTVFVRHLVQKSVDVRAADDAVGFEATSSFERFGG